MGEHLKRLKELRLAKGISQKEIAEYLGITVAAYSLYERGNREPNISILRKIAEYYSISMDELLEANNEPHDIKNTDEKDIAKDMENIRQKLMNGADGPLSYDGEPIPKEDTELLLGQIELMIRRLKPINKEKYNPNKNK